MKPQIVVRELCKTYRVPEREEGLVATLRGLIHRRYRHVPAVNKITFTVNAGEVIGFIGANGAGKTTTLKMLSGLLHPTSGEALVEDFVPWQRHTDYLRRISLVMANKNQLNWENTAMDSFRVLAEIYGVPPRQFRHTLDELIALLDMEGLLPQLVRNLSLGQRMKCELVAALLHQPRLIFMDEPTLGLDVTMQLNLRRFLAAYNQRHEATMIITSHYMADVTALCSRVILIDNGQILYDGELPALAERIAPFKLIRLTVGGEAGLNVDDELSGLSRSVTVVERNGRRFSLRVGKADAARAVVDLLSKVPVIDVTVEDPPVEAVIDQIYREGIGTWT